MIPLTNYDSSEGEQWGRYNLPRLDMPKTHPLFNQWLPPTATGLLCLALRGQQLLREAGSQQGAKHVHLPAVLGRQGPCRGDIYGISLKMWKLWEIYLESKLEMWIQDDSRSFRRKKSVDSKSFTCFIQPKLQCSPWKCRFTRKPKGKSDFANKNMDVTITIEDSIWFDGVISGSSTSPIPLIFNIPTICHGSTKMNSSKTKPGFWGSV